MLNVNIKSLNLDSYANLCKKQQPKNEKVIALEQFINSLMILEKKNLSITDNNNSLSKR